jgi:dephospho-CoA kinase
MHRPLKPRGPWANGPIPVVGLVGGIGAGKSLAAAALADLGLHRLDADAVGHALLTQRPSRDLVVERFGSGILLPVAEGVDPADAEIDRNALGRIVFTDPGARRELEAIVHPPMRKTFERAISRAARQGLPGVVLDAAILYEAGWNSLCDAVLFIDAPHDQRLARINAERGWSAEDLDLREKAQAPLGGKRDRADQVIVNDGNPETFKAAVAAWWTAFVPPPKPTRPQGRPGR